MPIVDYNQVEFERTLARDLGRDLPFAAARALTWTAKDAETAAKKEWIPRTFDRPTRFTVNSPRTKPALKRDLVAEVLFKDSSAASIDGDGHYLVPQVIGGTRVHTPWEKRLIRKGVMRSSEFAMPGKGLRLDRAGNVPRGVYAQVMAQLSLGDEGYNSKESEKSKAAKARRGAARFFVTDGSGNLPRGIWQRRGRSISPLFVFVSKRPHYRAIFHWKQWTATLVRSRFPANFRRSAMLILRKPNR